jgi:hypothetical protein
MSDQPPGGQTPSGDAGNVEAILARAEAEREETVLRHQAVQAEARRREAVVAQLLSAYSYTYPTGRTTDPSNWVQELGLLLEKVGHYVSGGIMSQIPRHGEARSVSVSACALIQSGNLDGAEKLLGRALNSALTPDLWADLSRHFPEDVSRLLPDDLRAEFERRRPGEPRPDSPAESAAPGPAPPATDLHAPEPTSETAPAVAGVKESSRSWKDVAEGLKRIYTLGEPWTSQHEMAQRLECSSSTVNRALKETPELHSWAGIQEPASRVERFKDITLEETEQKREPNPLEDAYYNELRQRFENATPEERAFLNEVGGASREFLLWYLKQSSGARADHREKWGQAFGSDHTNRAWFFGHLTPQQQIDYFDDPGRHQKISRPTG